MAGTIGRLGRVYKCSQGSRDTDRKSCDVTLGFAWYSERCSNQLNGTDRWPVAPVAAGKTL